LNRALDNDGKNSLEYIVTFDLKQHLTKQAGRIETVLDQLLNDAVLDEEMARPPRLLAAMRHGALNGGKRLRPVLVMETAKLFGRDDDGVLLAASALELVHCYSLVHDDLPAMDDDDLRRGRPTVHRAFDEATAILAGDALLTLAFDVIANEDVHDDPAVRLRLSRELSRAAGIGGMAGGQMLDLESEHRDRSEAEIRTLQSMKTGALLRYACRAGAFLAGAPVADLERMSRFGEVIGLDRELANAIAKSQLGAGVALPTSGTVFLSVKNDDKEALIPLAKDLSNLGFKLVATGGTCKFLKEQGLDVERINKVLEGQPHIVDAIINGNINLMINTTSKSSQAAADSTSIRRMAMQYKIPYYTLMSAAKAGVQAIKALASHDLEVAPLQDYFEDEARDKDAA